MVNVPVPRAVALLISRIAPASKVTPPVKVLAPAKVRVPAESVTFPDVVPITPFNTKVPAPADVKLSVAPPMAPPIVNVPVLLVTVTVGEAPKVTAPVPRFKLLLPVKVKLLFQLWALLFDSVMLAVDVLSMVPPAMVNVPVPRAVALLMSKVPAFKVTPPVKVLAPARVKIPADSVTVPVVVPTTPLRISVPEPALMILSPAPEIAPPTVKVFPVTVTVGLAPSVTAPVPRFKEEEPVKVKLAFQCWALLFDSVIFPVEVLSMVPPAMVNVPVPRAVALLISRIAPASKVTPPVKVLAPAKVRVPAESVTFPDVVPITPFNTKVPAPADVKLSVAPPMAPPIVNVPVLLVTVTVGEAPKVTAPVPRFKLLLPVKVKLLFQLWALLFDSVMLAVDVLSMVPPAMVNVPVPRAVALLMSKVPAFKVTPPVKVLAPAKVKIPADSVTVPVVVPTTPLRISVPAPALMILSPAPEIAPPTVKVFPVTVTVGLAPSVTAPVPRFKEEEPVKAKLAFQCWALLFDSVIFPVEVLSMVPPAMVNVPVPSAVALLISRIAPASKVTPPVKVLAPAKVKVPAESVTFPDVVPITPFNTKVPAPADVKLSVAPPMAPPTVNMPVLLVTVTVGLAPKVTAPVPRFNEEPPVKVKLPFQCWALLFVEVAMLLPEVLSMVPLVMVKVPVPKAAALLISRVPAVNVTPPVKVLTPARVKVPAVTVTVPDVVPTTPLRTRVPEPAVVRLSPAPEIAPPTVKVLPVTVTVGEAPKVTAPVPKFKEEEPVKVKLAFQCWVLLFDKVMAPAEVLSMVPPAMVKRLVPKAVALLMSIVPELSVVVPL